MSSVASRLKEGEGVTGLVHEAFPGAYYARNPLHPLHRENGLVNSVAFRVAALSLRYRPVVGVQAYSDDLSILRSLARIDGTFPDRRREVDGKPIEWDHRLVAPSTDIIVHHTLLSISALEGAYERREAAGLAMPPAWYQEVTNRVLSE